VDHDTGREGGDVGTPAPATPQRPGSAAGAAAPTGGWLTEEQQEAWKAVFGLASLLPGPLDAQLQRDSGLSLFEYSVLSSLSMTPGRSARMSALARRSSGSLTRLSNVVRKLEGRGLVRRSPDPADGRFTVAQLTHEGWDVVEAAAPGHVDAVRAHVLAPLDPEHLAALVDVAERLGVMPRQIDDC
jgi:DNA-binding MarR family transcriptional regulator